LHVEQQLLLLPKRAMFLAPPKTESSDRKIPLGDVVITALARHLEVFPPACALEALSGRQEPLLFSTERGEPISRTRFSDVWRPAAEAAGLAGKVTYHDLRHYYASLLIGRGASVKVVQARLGHKSATETLDTYSHLWPDDEDLTRNATDAGCAG
jgi:integrase